MGRLKATPQRNIKQIMGSQITNQRYQSLDFIRGVAIVLMLIYHMCFGLAQLDIIQAKFSIEPFWISFRTLIVFLFLSLVGIGLYLSSHKKLLSKAYFKRLALLVIYAMAISGFSYAIRPGHYVYFGILHLIFVSSILGLLLCRLRTVNLLLAIIFVIIGVVFKHNLFDSSATQWTGLSSVRQRTDDFAPLFPWFGIVCFGIFAGYLIFDKGVAGWFKTFKSTHWISDLLCWSGRYSIHIYFVHFQFFYVLVWLFS